MFSEKYFNQAVTLLNTQIDLYKGGKDFFINYEYYLNNIDYTFFLDQKNINEYFTTKISNQVFFGLEDEFFSLRYPVPKGLTGIRNVVFISYPLLLVYYSVCLYLLDSARNLFLYENQSLKQSLKENGSTYNHFSGNGLHSIDLEKTPNKKTLYYHSYYKKHINFIKGNTKPDGSSVHILKFDIQNCFENIQIDKLLNYIGNIENKEEIVDFFHFLNEGHGLIQSDNNLLSSTIADIYLMHLDHKILDFLKIRNIKFEFSRYVDDTYIIFNKKDDSKFNFVNFFYYELLPFIEDTLHQDLGLRLNINKTQVWEIITDAQWKEFIKDLTTISQVDMPLETDEEDDKDFETSALNFLEGIQNINVLHNDGVTGKISLKKSAYNFNEIFTKDGRGNGMITWLNNYGNGKEDNLHLLLGYPKNLLVAFDGFNFQNTLFAPKAILAIIRSNNELKNKFIEAFSAKKEWTVYDIFLISSVLIEDVHIFNANKSKIENTPYCFISKFYESKVIHNKETKDNIYFFLKENQELCDQVKLRVTSEKRGEYAKAFNHLLNEFHLAIFIIQTDFGSSIEKYDRDNVVVSIQKQFIKFTIPDIINVQKFFDRRNKNNISHGGGLNISKKEYMGFKKMIFGFYPYLYE